MHCIKLKNPYSTHWISNPSIFHSVYSCADGSCSVCSCADGSRSVYWSWVCDENSDCTDSSDE